MATRPAGANRVIAASACLAALAILLLGWQIIQSLGLTGVASATVGNADRFYWLSLLIAVAVCGIVSALFWAVVYNTRACQRAESRVQWMARRLPGAFYAFRLADDGRGTYEFLSANAEELAGVSREEVVQDANVAHRLVLREDRARLSEALVYSKKNLSPLNADFRIRKPDGEVRWIRTLGVPTRESHGEVLWNGHMFDITDIRMTERALRDASLRLEYAQSVAHLGDWSCDFATGAVIWSPQVYQLLGRDPALGSPSLAETLEMVVEGPTLIANAFEMAETTGEPQFYETTAELPGGNVVALHVIVLAVFNDAGDVTGMRGTIQDITAHKALEQRLSLAKQAADSANRAKSAFLATMSHEIRTPLNGMLGILELISLTPVDPEIRLALEDVRDSGKSLQRIIDDILDFSKVEAGKLEIHPEATRLADLVDSVYRIYAGSGSSMGLDFRRYVDPDISPSLMLDPLRLRQILSNFVSNAIKFTPKGSVELRVLSSGRDGDLQGLRFEVADTGIGISPMEQKKLFEPFEQAQSIATRFGGTGLGLSISRGLAELMGGRVSMSSELGVGTTMSLDISVLTVDPALVPPCSGDQRGAIAELQAAASRPTRTSNAEPETFILVVDDHPVNRMVMHRQIVTIGYSAVVVETADEAFEQWRTGKFSLLLTDLNMPHTSGYDLSRRIRQAESVLPGRRTPIIACSANVIAGVIEDCRDAGIDDYIPKPTKLHSLSEKLARWLPSPGELPEVGAALQQHLARAADDEVACGSAGMVDDVGLQLTPTGDAGEKYHKKQRRLTPQAIALFREVNEVDVQQLLEGIKRGDMAVVAHLAHRIKGACSFVGATGLVSVCAMIEHAGHEGDGAGAERLIDAFQIELEQLNAILDT